MAKQRLRATVTLVVVYDIEGETQIDCLADLAEALSGLRDTAQEMGTLKSGAMPDLEWTS